jgi:hypothetical protein
LSRNTAGFIYGGGGSGGGVHDKKTNYGVGGGFDFVNGAITGGYGEGPDSTDKSTKY